MNHDPRLADRPATTALAVLVLSGLSLVSCIPFGAEPPACLSALDCPNGEPCVDALCVGAPDMDLDRAVPPRTEFGPPRDAATEPAQCETGLPGLCNEGRQERSGCVALYEPGAVPEGCEANGIDEDCDRKVDEAAATIDTPCVPEGSVGECRNGAWACEDDVPRCRSLGGVPELCDGLDNDCDGNVDNAPQQGVGEPCTLPEGMAIGGCQRGIWQCPLGAGALHCDSIGQQPEVCNGIDDDCDGTIDDLPPGGDCVPSHEGMPLRGLCHRGRELCVPVEAPDDGMAQPTAEMRCVPWLPRADGWQAACNLVDDDCDGAYDEAAEQHVLTLAPEMLPFDPAYAERLRSEQPLVPGPDEPALTGDVIRPEAPGEADEGPLPHPCVDPVCAAACLDAQPPDADGYRACLRAQGCSGAPGVTEWTCGEDSLCAATSCARYFRFDDDPAPRCRPLEICNNGEDDDLDGLVDASADDPSVCEARIDAQGEANILGTCDGDCDGAPPGLSPNPDEYCWPSPDAPCPRRVTSSYDYTLDKEEVSVRAYLRCVEEGFCTDPAVPFFDGVRAWGEANPPARRTPPAGRPPEDQRNVHTTPVPLDGRGHPAEALLDLPVTGVSWCQARRYCAWAGKRLPTEFEWERAATGPEAERRFFPWGNATPPRCPLDTCCTDEGVDPPPLCRPGQGTRTCGEGDEPDPTGVQTWPAGYGMFEGQCVDQLAAVEPGLFPVWSFPEGATPEGARNMAGNAGEWVYDRQSYSYGTTGTTDAIGPGCMPPLAAPEARPPDWHPDQWAAQPVRFPEMRIFRGGMYNSPNYVLRGTNRMPMFPASPIPFIGFRCARTLSDDGLCLADMPSQQERTRNAARTRMLEAGAAAVSCAPAFHQHSPPEINTCPGRRPAPGGLDCSDSQRECAAVDADVAPPSCGSYLISSLRVATDRLILPPGVELRGEAVGLLEAVFTGALAPAGGSSFLVVDLEPDFHLSETDSPLRFGTAYRSDGRLHWIGLEGPDGCERQPVAELAQARTLNTCCDAEPDAACANAENIQICPAGAETTGRMMLTSLPIGVALSNIDIVIEQGEFRATERRIRSGTMSIYINRRVAAEAWFGDPQYRSAFLFSRHMGLPEIDLCPLASLLPGCGLAPGCVAVEGFPVCPEGEDECRGYFLPFSFEAVRLDKAIEDELVGGLGDMRCPGICSGD